MSLFRRCLGLFGLLLSLNASLARSAKSVSGTILVLARNLDSANQATAGLNGYGIPYQVTIVPKAGIMLPDLQSSDEDGNYGGIIIMSELAYDYGVPPASNWASALNSSQWQQLYTYQRDFNVRMCRIDAFPSPAEFGAQLAVSGMGCCEQGQEQLIKIVNDADFPTANLKTGEGVSSRGLWHYPATIVNSAETVQIATFDPVGEFTETTTAAVINRFSGREQMVWFVSWATDWAAACNYLQHATIHWLTRGLFVGKRKVFLNAHIDDVHLYSMMYDTGLRFRIRPGDLDAHKAWQEDLNSRLPPGSEFFLDLAHNGNGAITGGILIDDPTSSSGFAVNGQCTPPYPVSYPMRELAPYSFKKPDGIGIDLWADEWTTYPWSLQCNQGDDIASWFLDPSNRAAFAHVSHTFTHEEMNNATFHDAALEIKFNRAWLDQMGISSESKYSPKGLVPPAITGLLNGDVIRAWMENGIEHVVGDNTRKVLRSTESPFWPRITTDIDNGYSGLVIIPRWATTIYYNCDTAACTLKEWIDTSGGAGDFEALLENAKATNTRYLLGLYYDPFMFHQANLRHIDMPVIKVGNQEKQMSLVQAWIEVVVQEMVRLTNWPIRSLPHDQIATVFLDRMTVDGCSPKFRYNYNDAGTAIVSATITTDSNMCNTRVPLTVPGPGTSTGSAVLDKVGTDPLIVWYGMDGSANTFTLETPIVV